MELSLLTAGASWLCCKLILANLVLSRSPSPDLHPVFLSNLSNIKPASYPLLQTKLAAKKMQVRVKKIDVVGSTVLSAAEIDKITSYFINRDLTFEELLSIRTIITDEYVKRGYITSGAFLPAQDISSGTLRVQVIEAELEKIEIHGLHHLHKSYVRSRITQGAGKPFNRYRLEAALQLLQQDPLFTNVQAELTAGIKPGSNVLILNLKEAPAVSSALVIDNQESASVGSFGATAIAGYNNLLGIGDHLSANVGITEGVRSYNFAYDVPVNANEGRISLRYSKGRSTVVEQPFAPLDINGRAETYSLGFTQPLIRTPNTEFSLSLSGDLRRSRTSLLGEPYSFTTGPEKGESRVSVLRFSQDWVNRTTNKVLAARSQFSLGIDAFDATINNTGTDAGFFSWLGQFQWLQALNDERDAVFVFRTAAQLSGDSLLLLEQLSISGVNTVRGYRNNSAVGDSGIVASAEVRLPVVRDPGGWGLVQIVPFIDAGTNWSNKETNANPTLLSTGLGLRWQLSDRASAQVDWGIPLIEGGEKDSDLQFSLRFQPF